MIEPIKPPRSPKFPMGQVVITANAQGVLEQNEVFKALQRHLSGDWGDCSSEDKQENDFALQNRSRIFSVYHDAKGLKFWIVTGADRSSTCVLLPEDY